MAELAAHAKNVVEAFNNDDWDAVRELLGDSTYNELGTQRSLAGADTIIEALQGWKAAMPEPDREGGPRIAVADRSSRLTTGVTVARAARRVGPRSAGSVPRH